MNENAAEVSPGGLTAVSMPRLAHRLGMTQNALYRYVTSKDDLLVLMGDADTRRNLALVTLDPLVLQL